MDEDYYQRKRDKLDRKPKTKRTDRPPKTDRTDRSKTERTDRYPKTERTDRHLKTESTERYPKTERTGLHLRTERTDLLLKTERTDRYPKTERTDRHPKTERTDRHPKTERTDRHPGHQNNFSSKRITTVGFCTVKGCTHFGNNVCGGMCYECFHTQNTSHKVHHSTVKEKYRVLISHHICNVMEKHQKISLDDLQHHLLKYSKEKHIRYLPEHLLPILEGTALVEVKDGFVYALPKPPREHIEATVRAFVSVHPNERISHLHRFLCEVYQIDHFRQLGQGKILPFLVSLGYELSQTHYRSSQPSLLELVDLFVEQHDPVILPQLVTHLEGLWGAKVFLKLFQKHSISTFLTKNGWLVNETGEMRKLPKPGEEELIRTIIEWRNSAEGAIIGIDDLEDYLSKNLSRPFPTLGYGHLEDFLKRNHFTIMAVNKKLFFNPEKSETPGDHPTSEKSEKSENSNQSSGEEEEEEEDDSELCKICMERPLDCVVLICGHLCMCCECAAQFSQCPICRQGYNKQHIVKVFKS